MLLFEIAHVHDMVVWPLEVCLLHSTLEAAGLVLAHLCSRVILADLGLMQDFIPVVQAE